MRARVCAHLCTDEATLSNDFEQLKVIDTEVRIRLFERLTEWLRRHRSGVGQLGQTRERLIQRCNNRIESAVSAWAERG